MYTATAVAIEAADDLVLETAPDTTPLAEHRPRQVYLSPKAEVRDSTVHGRGLFANCPIMKDELVILWGGPTMTRAEVVRLQPDVRSYPLQIWFNLFMGPRCADEIEPVDFLNHSCEPTLGMRGSVAFVARRDIEVSEVLTFDYGTTESYPWRMRCRCGAASCRGVVTGDDWRDPAFRARHAGYLSEYIRQLIAWEGSGEIVGFPCSGVPQLARA